MSNDYELEVNKIKEMLDQQETIAKVEHIVKTLKDEFAISVDAKYLLNNLQFVDLKNISNSIKVNLDEEHINKLPSFALKSTNSFGGKDIDDLNAILEENFENVYFKTRTPEDIPMNYQSCSYFTFCTSDFETVSDHYNFANKVTETTICSHPQLSKENKISYCSYISNQLECPHYAADQKVLEKVAVTSSYAKDSYEYELVYSTTVDIFNSIKCHNFKIICTTNLSLVNELNYPQEVVDFENAKDEAIRIFNDYISMFNSDDYKLNELEPENNSKETVTLVSSPKSYIEHILSLT